MITRHQRLDMGYRPDEFEHTLNRAFANAPARRIEEGHWHWRDHSGVDVRIVTRPLPDRRIALLTLPRLEVDLDLQAERESAIDAFIKRFQQHFHKGGG